MEKRSHPRSCLSCRARKIRCDRGQPCASCERADAPCVYPPGPGRAPKQARNARLLDRISRLETIIRRLEEENVQCDPASGHGSGSSATPPVEQLGRLVVNDTRSYYISNVLWARLGDEVEELRDALDEPTSEPEDSWTEEPASSFHTMPRGLGTNAAIMGFRSLASSLTALHPALSESVALLEIFKQNVAPLVRIFHMPTLLRLYWDAVAAVDTVEKETEALLFAIYYSAVISMEPAQCLATLGVERSLALRTYRFAVEQALARANLLNTQNITLLQATVLFLTALRNEDDSRTIWSLTALIFHIAQAMGLHRDGAPFGLPPLETELRRRLWWYICLLDNRSSEYHGCQPIVQDESTFDTRMPLNINDADLSAATRHPPPERADATEMTFCLIRCHAMLVMWKIGYIPATLPSAVPSSSSSSSSSRNQAPALTLADREALAQELQTRLETEYLPHYTNASSNDPFHAVAAAVTRLIIARTWLVVYYPSQTNTNEVTTTTTTTTTAATNNPDPTRTRLFDLSLSVLSLSSALLANAAIQQWAWHYQTHFQWHATVLVLSEICRRPPSPQCDRAWDYVNSVYARWSENMRASASGHWRNESGARGALWRPVMRLMAKARYVREIQRAAGSGASAATATARRRGMPCGRAGRALGMGADPDPGTGEEVHIPGDGDGGGESECGVVVKNHSQDQGQQDYAGAMPSVFPLDGLDSLQIMGMGMGMGFGLEPNPFQGMLP